MQPKKGASARTGHLRKEPGPGDVVLRAPGQASHQPHRSGLPDAGGGSMIPLLIALAVACVAFWRVVWRILMIVVLFLFAWEIVLIIQDMHHLVR